MPSALRVGDKKLLPLGRYLQRQLRLMVGHDEKTPQAILDKIDAEMFDVRVAARSSAEAPSIRSQVELSMKGKLANLESRARFNRRRSL